MQTIPTAADLVREMIWETTERVRQAGGDLIDGGSERIESLWMEMDAHLRAADLCELLGNYDKMNGHFDAVNVLLEKIENELPD